VRCLILLFLLYPAIPVSADGRFDNLASCWDKSLELLDQAKSDIDGSYDQDPWYIKHQNKSAECREIRDQLKKQHNIEHAISCVPRDNRKHSCAVQR
jgi:hypothetical protein